jgi:hypothetical protein
VFAIAITGKLVRSHGKDYTMCSLFLASVIRILRAVAPGTCEDFIRGLLGYAMPIQSVKMECQEAGFSLRTTERAAHNLGLVRTRQYGLNMWSLPKAE